VTIDSAKRKTPSKEANAIYLILIGLVKVNFALLEENDVVDMIVATCSVCLKATTNDDVYNSLALMDVVVRYAYVPFSSLDVFVQTLCHTVNVERYISMLPFNINKFLVVSGLHRAAGPSCAIFSGVTVPTIQYKFSASKRSSSYWQSLTFS